MYDSPTQRDERIARLEKRLLEAERNLATATKLLAATNLLGKQAAEKHNGLVTSTASVLKLHEKRLLELERFHAFISEDSPEVFAKYAEWKAGQPADSGQCNCPACSAARDAGVEIDVETIDGDDAVEYLRRLLTDGPRAAAEWLGQQQLKRGAEGR